MRAILTTVFIVVSVAGAHAQSPSQAIVQSTAAPEIRTYDASGRALNKILAQDLLGHRVTAGPGALPLLAVETASGLVYVNRSAVKTSKGIAPPSANCVKTTSLAGNSTTAGTNGFGRTCNDLAHAN